MFSFSPSELLTIGLVALIVFGPRRLPEIARRAGRMVAYLRSAAAEIRSEVDDLDAIAKPFREAASDLAAAGKVASHIGRTGPLSELPTMLHELEAGAYVGRAVIDDLAG